MFDWLRSYDSPQHVFTTLAQSKRTKIWLNGADAKRLQHLG